MALILPVLGKSPLLGEKCFVAENATIVGDVILGDNCSVWFNAVIRGDVNYIRIGNNTNIQDGVVIHCTYQYAATEVGNNVSIGHNALVHGCKVHDHVLIGMVIVMDHAVIEEYTIIAAGAIVLETLVASQVIFMPEFRPERSNPLQNSRKNFWINFLHVILNILSGLLSLRYSHSFFKIPVRPEG